MWNKDKNVNKGWDSTAGQYRHRVAKPVHKFTDLEVYQHTLAASVIILKDIQPKLAEVKYVFTENMTNCATSLPMWLSEAHSMRFVADHGVALGLLEKVMAGCNKMVVYLDQIKGMYRPDAEVKQSVKRQGFDPGLIDDLIRRYHDIRAKVFRLEKSWQKWYEPNRPGSDIARALSTRDGKTK